MVLFGLPQQTSGPRIQTFDASLLAGFYNARLAQSGVASARAGAAALQGTAQTGGASARGEAVLPPWDVRTEQQSADERLRKALATSDFIGDTRRLRESADPELQKLFTLYQALSKLDAIAGHATDKATSALRLPGLDRQFQDGLSQVFDFVAGLETVGFTVSAGDREKRAEAGVVSPRALSQYTSRIIHRSGLAEPLGNLSGTETFSVTANKLGTTVTVDMDLSQVSGDLTLDNVLAYMNTRMEAEGLVTRFTREKIEPETPRTDEDGAELPSTLYAVGIRGTSTEQLSFSSAGAEAAVYLSAVSGKEESEGGQFVKFAENGGDPAVKVGVQMTAEGEEALAAPTGAARDSRGNVYVVGTSTGGLDGQVLQGESDAYLTKYDAAGQVVWTRMLGVSEQAENFAVAVDADDNVVVAGTVRGEAAELTRGGGTDSFVAKFDADGAIRFRRQIAPLADDGAAALTTGADGSIYVVGQTKGALDASAGFGGAVDGYLTKLSADGDVQFNRRIGEAGEERARAVAIAGDGNVLIASEEDGRAILRKFDSAAGTTDPIWEVDLGALDNGAITGLAVDGGSVYLAGSTGNADLTAGGQAGIVGAHSGGRDGFVARIDDAGASAAAGAVTYLGSGASDKITALTLSGGAVYVAGDTLGALPGETKTGQRDGFFAKLGGDLSTQYTHQFAGRSGENRITGIAVDQSGASVLDALGLPTGQVSYTSSRNVVDISSVREGQYFHMVVDGGAKRKIAVDADDDLRDLARKIQNVLLLNGEASVRRTSEGSKLRIEGKEGVRIDLIAGEGADDALKGLGLKPGAILNTGSLLDEKDEGEEDGPLFFGLGLTGNLSLADNTRALAAKEALSNAMSEIRKAYRKLTQDPALTELINRRNAASGPVPAALQAQLANYQAGLARLSGGGGGGGLGGLF